VFGGLRARPNEIKAYRTLILIITIIRPVYTELETGTEAFEAGVEKMVFRILVFLWFLKNQKTSKVERSDFLVFNGFF